jgi:hypothetical protein
MKNAILFYITPTFRLTGSTINAIEYFLAGYEHNPDLKLYLIHGSKKANYRRKILKLIHDRYDMTGDLDQNHPIMDAYHNIEYLSRWKVPHCKFDTVLILDYMTIHFMKGILRANKILVISEKYTDLPQYFLSKSLYNVEYYGEMPFHYKDHDYRMKCLFKRYKNLGKDVQKGTYVNSPKNEDIIYKIDRLREVYIHLPTPFIFKSKVEHEENLFNKFTHYLYYHADKYFDPHPRLFLECRFYNKIITYVNLNEIKDGSWYRYYDGCENNLHNRSLNENDEIIRQLI